MTEPIAQPATIDDAAPYGRKADGTPKRRPGPAKGTPRGARKMAAPTSGGSPRRKSSTQEKQEVTDFTAPMTILGMLPASIATGLGQIFNNEPLQADGAAINIYVPNIAANINQLAQANETVRNNLNTFFQSGVGSGLVVAMGLMNALLPLAAQIRANHTMEVPEGHPSLLPRKTLIASAPNPIAVLMSLGIDPATGQMADIASTVTSENDDVANLADAA